MIWAILATRKPAGQYITAFTREDIVSGTGQHMQRLSAPFGEESPGHIVPGVLTPWQEGCIRPITTRLMRSMHHTGRLHDNPDGRICHQCVYQRL